MKSTLDQHIKGIVFQDLPKSFQEAITVSRSLGLPYLWIDSLCIIQDSNSDWERESQHMQDIYAHATLNIPADAATDPTIGEDMTVNKPGDVHAARGGCLVLDTHGLSHIPRDSPAEEHVLRRRAWVLQERTISRRILHFCKYELA
ncbi:heterokaryon incompatibility protein-domain-containing protein [Leptodontidium sp. 2 PMI_412]|nr:heterokaryon incompatibility protein-domain-containing protein [Leptodontidium sp. 2 PMI_412]